jgi:hypothetical protein
VWSLMSLLIWLLWMPLSSSLQLPSLSYVQTLGFFMIARLLFNTHFREQ